jgi:hypothetical protein
MSSGPTGRSCAVIPTRVRIPLGSSRGLGFGYDGDEPVIITGDRDEMREIGEALEERIEVPPVPITGVVLHSGQVALEVLYQWDSSPRIEAGLVVGYALGGRAARGETAAGTAADRGSEDDGYRRDIPPEEAGLWYLVRELLLERDRLMREVAAVGPEPNPWLSGRATGIWFALERVMEQLGLIEFDAGYILRGLEGRVPEHRSAFFDDSD